MKKNNLMIFSFACIYIRLLFLYYEAVSLGLRDKEPELFDEQFRMLDEMRKAILEEFGEE